MASISSLSISSSSTQPAGNNPSSASSKANEATFVALNNSAPAKRQAGLGDALGDQLVAQGFDLIGQEAAATFNAVNQTIPLVVDAINRLPANSQAAKDGKDLATNLKAMIASIGNEDAARAANAAAAAKQLAAELAKELATDPNAYSATGIFSAFTEYMNNASSILDLQSVTAQMTTKIATMLQNLAQQENQALANAQTTLNGIDDSSDHASSDIAKAQGNLQQIQSEYTNAQTPIQTQMTAWQNSVNDFSNTTTNDFKLLETISDFIKSSFGH